MKLLMQRRVSLHGPPRIFPLPEGGISQIRRAISGEGCRAAFTQKPAEIKKRRSSDPDRFEKRAPEVDRQRDPKGDRPSHS